MQIFRDLSDIVAATWAEWGDLRLDRLLYSEVATARQILDRADRVRGDLHGDSLVR